MKLSWPRRANRYPVGQILTIEEHKLGIIDLGKDISRNLRNQIDRNILTHGEPFKSGGVLGSACLPVIGAGSTVASSLFAGNVFLATANPASLMSIGAGVGSAVTAGGQIVAQAPFIAAGSAIVPVVAPIMFFMIVSSMMMSARFDQIQLSLEQLARAVEQMLKREVAGDYGILLSAMERLRDIEAEYSESRRFTEEMKIRAAIAERDVNVLHHKYDILSTRRIGSLVDAKLAATDIDLFTVSSLADIQVDGLRLKLALQDNPDDVVRSLSMLNAKINRYEGSFSNLLKNDSVQRYRDELQESVDSMGWWTRNVFARKQGKQAEQEIEETRAIHESDLEPVRLNIARWSEHLKLGKDSGHEQSVWYYRGRNGEEDLKAFYTSDWKLQARE